MRVWICIGSSCHVRGSKEVIETLTGLVKEKHVKAELELAGSFCMGACSKGVSVRIGERIYHVRPEDAKDFFYEVILKEAERCG